MSNNEQTIVAAIKVGEYGKLIEMKFSTSGIDPIDVLALMLNKSQKAVEIDSLSNLKPPFSELVGTVLKVERDIDGIGESGFPEGDKFDAIDVLERIEYIRGKTTYYVRTYYVHKHNRGNFSSVKQIMPDQFEQEYMLKEKEK